MKRLRQKLWFGLAVTLFLPLFSLGQSAEMKTRKAFKTGQEGLFLNRKSPWFLKVGVLYGTNSLGYWKHYYNSETQGLRLGEYQCVYTYYDSDRKFGPKRGGFLEFGFHPLLSAIQEISYQSSYQDFLRDEICDKPIPTPPYNERIHQLRLSNRKSSGLNLFTGLIVHTNTNHIRFGGLLGMDTYFEKAEVRGSVGHSSNTYVETPTSTTRIYPSCGMELVGNWKSIELGMRSRTVIGQNEEGILKPFAGFQASFTLGVIL